MGICLQFLKSCDSVPFSSCNKENVSVPSRNKQNMVECGGTPKQFLPQTLTGSGSYSNCNLSFNFSLQGSTVYSCIPKSGVPCLFYVCTSFTCTCIFFQNELNVCPLPVFFIFMMHSYSIWYSCIIPLLHLHVKCVEGLLIQTQVALIWDQWKHCR